MHVQVTTKVPLPQPVYIGLCINCFGQTSVMIERFLPKLAPLDGEKILLTYISKKPIAAGPYMVYLRRNGANLYGGNGHAVWAAQLTVQFAKAHCYRDNAC
jgi:hypothetical protein